ncbi:MAG: hypothetical protein ACP6IP_10825 [Candidatus Njordarchaeia archaeon]
MRAEPLDLEINREINRICDYILELLYFFNLSDEDKKEFKETLNTEIDDLISRVIKQRIKSAVDGLLQEIDQREKKLASEDRLSIGIYVDVINELENVKKLIKKWFPDVFKERD